MAPVDAASSLEFARFAVGQPVRRTEDPKLLRGQGRYTDDVTAAGQVHAWILRSPHAHGVIRRIDVEAARRLPGVLAAWTGADLATQGYGHVKSMPVGTSRDGSPMKETPRPALAVDKVRYVGDPIAIVVAETRAQARDAAEAIELDIEPLPAVTGPRAALASGAPQLYDGVPGNLQYDALFGDPAAVAAAFAKAAHVVKRDLSINRVVVSAMEPRAALAEFDATTERWTVTIGSQGAFGMRASLAGAMNVAPERIRVLTPHVGGSFGMKAGLYPEYIAVLHAARALRRPVKWLEERSASFLSDQAGRDHEVTAELALDAEGRFLALRIQAYGNLGAYVTNFAPMIPSLGLTKNVIGVYRTPLLEVATRCAVTNTSPLGPYRGAGRPEGNYVMERLVDAAAAEMKLDPIEIRRRNHIGPADMPYAAPNGMTYDVGEFAAVLDKAVAAADWNGFGRRKAESKARGRLRGRGLAQYLEVTAASVKEMGGIRFDADGGVTIVTGTLDYGQGHAAPFAQVLAARLGLPFERIRLLQGDSDELVAGGGTGGSRSMMMSGSAIANAAQKVIEAGRQIASVVLEAAIADIEFVDGRFRIVGTDRAIGLLELAAKLRAGMILPANVPTSLDVTHVDGAVPSAFPNGAHVAEVEIDPETGVVEVVGYASVNDFGVIVNPLLVEGQVHGGVVQGIGQVLMERVVYDGQGQPLAGSYMDYAMPRAGDVPPIGFASHPVPAKTNILGVKGCGEAGCAGSMPAVVNAVVDALREFGVEDVPIPATREVVWRAIRGTRA
ncbi:MAG: xanthine dehydrogenase family protein molybdopterin-binding subunit [Alphaproteobacteria bacterium]|nr:xanthine dehydrogenase family protein molybdopterin-binding subunit [Alphaproteobacteria bacterium]